MARYYISLGKKTEKWIKLEEAKDICLNVNFRMERSKNLEKWLQFKGNNGENL